MEVQGKIKVIGKTQEFGSNGFQKREIVVTTKEQYPQHILIEFVQDKCALLDSYKEGQDVKIAFNLRGREWVNPEGVAKYFNSLNGWKIYESDAKQVTSVVDKATPNVEQTNEPGDLPF